MSVSDLLLYASLALYALFFLLERGLAARLQPALRGWAAIGAVFFGGYTAIGIALPLALPPAWFEHALLPGAQLGVAGGAAVGFLALTLANYAWHRAVHRVPLLWRMFHQVHHSARRLDVSGAFVFHPTEMAAYTLIAVAVTTLVLGLDPLAASLVGLMLNFNALFQHANIRTPRWLGWIVQRPEAHAIHHAFGVHGYNYSDFPLWDLLFGTYRAGNGFTPRVGFEDHASRRWWDLALLRDVHEPDFSLGPARRGTAA